jgi:hypothetical protein
MLAGRKIVGRSAAIYFVLSPLALAIFLANGWIALAQYPSGSQITKDGTAILIEDYADVPPSNPTKDGPYPAKIDPTEQVARVNALRSEPADVPTSTTRFFVADNNGILYIMDKKTRKFTPYIDFGKVFPIFANSPNIGPGVISITFDPAYSKNGKFYTIHTEKPGGRSVTAPTNASMPSLSLAGYEVTPGLNAPTGEILLQSVLIEWTDTNIKNSTFEGTAREILREGYNYYVHHMEDTVFNPLAHPGQADYGNLYVAVGDGGAGERAGVTHPTPQRLDAIQGKILRITPDITLHPSDQLSSNGRYRIPSTGRDPNPFVSVEGARGEIYAYGIRNPVRLNWDRATNTLLAGAIGNHSWESVIVIKKGANYGWAEREGPEQPIIDAATGGKTGSQLNPPVPFPSMDTISVERLKEPVTPVYPVAVYSHRDGDAIGGGYVYRGKLMPQMTGKYIFTDMTTGRIFYTDLKEMLSAGGVRNKLATIHEIQMMYKNPRETASKGPEKRRMYDIVADAFAHKGGVALENTVLPGAAVDVGGGRGATIEKRTMDTYGVPYGGGRADVRLSMGADGEIYMLTKSDGMIRKMVAVVTPPPA